MNQEEKINVLVKDVHDIKVALLGNKEFEQEGIISKVNKHEKYIQKSKLRLGFWSGISAGFGYIIHQLYEYFRH